MGGIRWPAIRVSIICGVDGPNIFGLIAEVGALRRRPGHRAYLATSHSNTPPGSTLVRTGRHVGARLRVAGQGPGCRLEGNQWSRPTMFITRRTDNEAE